MCLAMATQAFNGIAVSLGQLGEFEKLPRSHLEPEDCPIGVKNLLTADWMRLALNKHHPSHCTAVLGC